MLFEWIGNGSYCGVVFVVGLRRHFDDEVLWFFGHFPVYFRDSSHWDFVIEVRWGTSISIRVKTSNEQSFFDRSPPTVASFIGSSIIASKVTPVVSSKVSPKVSPVVVSSEVAPRVAAASGLVASFRFSE